MRIHNKSSQSINPAIAENQTNGLQKTQVVDVAGIEIAEKIIGVKSSLTLPATLAAYAAGDIITGIEGGVPKFVDVAKAAGRNVFLLSARIQTSEPSGLGGKSFNLHFYNDQPTVIADNAAFAIADVNSDKREGKATLTMGTGNLVKVGMTDTSIPNITMNPISRDVFYYLETVEGFTPTAISGVINIYTKWLIS